MSYRTTAASSSQDMDWNLAGLFKADRDSDPFSTEKTSRSARPSPYATLPSPATSSSSSSSCDSSPSGQIKDSYRTLTETARQVIKRLEHTRRSHNRDRDRHLYTTPFAHNQVKLNDGTGTNGSWISFPHDDPYAEKVHGPGKYIAISAPMPKYIPIFMRLLFEQRIPIIVSLTDFHENGHEKATPYLPYQLKETIRKKDSYSVTCTHVHQPITLAKDWKLQQRDFALKIHGSDKVHRFTQFHLPNWKDFTAGSSEGIFNLVKRVHTEKTRTKGPILAHCSGGVGRAGVFIICSEILEQAFAGKQPDIFRVALQSRIQRGNLGGHRDQFRMVYKVYEKMAAELSDRSSGEQPIIKISVRKRLKEGDFLTIRGSKEPLNWKAGIPLQRLGEDLWEIDLKNIPGCEFKLLLNDEKWEAGSNHLMNGKPCAFSSLYFS